MKLNSIKKVSILGASGMVAQETIKVLGGSGFKLQLFSRSIEVQKYPNHDVVRGDVFKDEDLEAAIEGSDAIHITLGQLDELSAVKKILAAAKKNKEIKLISYVSGATVSEKNTWFPIIGAKYRSEQLIKNSGIPYLILRPTWFIESLGLFIQGGRASIIGKQPNQIRWISSKDFGQLLANAYRKPESYNQEFNTYGPEALTMNEALDLYVKAKHPEISKVANVPFWVLKIIAFVSKNKDLKNIIPIFEYFEKTKEVGSPESSDRILGQSNTTIEKWLNTNLKA